jgi:hypothetical protein
VVSFSIWRKSEPVHRLLIRRESDCTGVEVMTSAFSPNRPPSLDELTARYLATATSDPVPEAVSEVELHEVSGGFRPPVRALWDEVFVSLRLFGLTSDRLTMPPEWSSFVTESNRLTEFPMAAGLFPQMGFPGPGPIGDRRNIPSDVPTATGAHTTLRGWVRKAARSHSATTLLVSSGLAALLGEHSEAEGALATAATHSQGSWKLAITNQRAAVLWLAGRRSEAVAIWDGMPESPVVEFNRGIAAISCDRPEQAVAHFRSAGTSLPDSSGWSHLAWIRSVSIPAGR